MRELVLQVISDYGYFGILLLIAFETVFPPLPSELILGFGGFMTAVTSMNIFGVVSAATVGSLLGATVLYLVARLLGRPGIEALASRSRGFNGEHLERAARVFERYQSRAILFSHMIPLVRSFISLPAGLAKMPYPRFLLLTTLGAGLWNTVLTCVGAFLGGQWESILALFQTYSAVALTAFAGLCAAGLLLLLRRRSRFSLKKER